MHSTKQKNVVLVSGGDEFRTVLARHSELAHVLRMLGGDEPVCIRWPM
jgi:hypothetical protein